MREIDYYYIQIDVLDNLYDELKTDENYKNRKIELSALYSAIMALREKFTQALLEDANEEVIFFYDGVCHDTPSWYEIYTQNSPTG